jgi:hypothetical protein
MDIADILRRTTFPRVIKHTGSELPKTIMAHDRIIWLGDLNYRVAASDLDTWKAVNQGDWDGLFQKDQVCELSEMILLFMLYASGCLQLPCFRSRTLKA